MAAKVLWIEKIEPHPDAERLDLATLVDGETRYQAVVGKGEWKAGAKAVLVLPGSVLADGTKIRETKIRGCVSQGLVKPLDFDAEPGEDVSERLGVGENQEVEASHSIQGTFKNPPEFGSYTEVEGLQRWANLLAGLDVACTLKVHGTNARFGFAGGEFLVGGHHVTHVRSESDAIWRMALQVEAERKLRETFPGRDAILHGEVYGWKIQELHYGLPRGMASFILFDVEVDNRYLSWDEVRATAERLALDCVPEIYRGPYDPGAIWGLREGPDLLCEANIRKYKTHDPVHDREGIVLRPLAEQWNPEAGRMIFKLKADKYAERKSWKERKPSPEKLAGFASARQFAEEFVTEERIRHVLDSLKERGIAGTDPKCTGAFLSALVADVRKESKGELPAGVEDNVLNKAISMAGKAGIQKVIEKDATGSR